MNKLNNIGYLLQHVAFMLSKQSEQVLQEQLGIGFSQFKILRTLQANPHVKQNQIASLLGQTEASISRQIKLMLKQGLLTTQINPTNQREHLTVSTQKGELLAEAAMSALVRAHQPTFDSLSPKQREGLEQSLMSLHTKLCPKMHAKPVFSNK